jgi:hypothetical protein
MVMIYQYGVFKQSQKQFTPSIHHSMFNTIVKSSPVLLAGAFSI